VIYFADLHVHSRYSRATSPDCNLVEMARWAAFKGIRVLATGDFTHPQWSLEIREMLQEDQDGLFRLKKEHVPEAAPIPGGFGPGDVRFILNVEISSIYKKNGAVRKVHNLVFMPDLGAVESFNERLDRIGNIKSDGRPILGLDSRDLLEIALETSSESFLVPAHIWTPWFSILGSKSGFDSVEECFGDLASHIFALETGLSSDPEMNYRVPSLDRYTLISNSDIHSPFRLGREANIFRGTPGYFSIREAIRAGTVCPAAPDEAYKMLASEGISHSEIAKAVKNAHDNGDPQQSVLEKDGFVGTLEFFPEEGKYHLDGHRKCSMRLDPVDTERSGGKCPVCGRPITVGVMNRVMELSDRGPGVLPERAAPFWRLLPLDEVISQAVGVGPQSKTVKGLHRELLQKLGPELNILWAQPLEEMRGRIPDIIVEGLRRARCGELLVHAGYDGQYGDVKLFTDTERDHFSGQVSLVPLEGIRRRKRGTARTASRKKKAKKIESEPSDESDHAGLNQEQEEAASTFDRPVLVQAGPGTGKTRTLTHRMASIIRTEQARPEEITAVTFTRKAAQEVRERLEALAPQDGGRCWIGTFHQLGIRIIDLFREKGIVSEDIQFLDEDEALSVFRQAAKDAGLGQAPASVPKLFNQVSLHKQNLVAPSEITDDTVARAYLEYKKSLDMIHALDLDDLLARSVTLLQDNPDEARHIRGTLCRHLLIDEFQDVNRAQYEMVRLLGDGADARGVFAIGDPAQAIYGFRGADRGFFLQFQDDYPSARHVRLTHNFRSQESILTAAQDVLAGGETSPSLVAEIPGGAPVTVARLPNAATEGEYIVRTIDALIGGSSFFSLDSRDIAHAGPNLGFRDFAVLFRLNAVGDALEGAFRTSGIPYQRVKKSNPRQEAEGLDPRAETVTLMTIHASKGLEFPVVFVAGCEEGIMPYSPPKETRPGAYDPGEERRLLYVAMTRARSHLFLTRSRARLLHGRRLNGRPSPYLDCLDRSVCEFIDPLESRSANPQNAPKQGELFG